MVAHSGITKLATPSLTPFLRVCANVTGMVAAEDWVPSAVIYAGIIFASIFTGFLFDMAPDSIKSISSQIICIANMIAIMPMNE